MEQFLHPPRWILTIRGVDYSLNSETLIMTWVVMGILVVLSLVVSHRLRLVPGPLQGAAEFVVVGFLNLTEASLGHRALGHFRLVCSMFLFILCSNWLGIVPYLSEPTADINTPLMLALLGFVVTHVSAIRSRGVRVYLKSYFEPFFLFFPLNVIGELGKVISLSFRLYGNIMGGALILILVSDLCRDWVLPPLLQFYFGVFSGVLQAFVFTMLTLTYLSVAVRD